MRQAKFERQLEELGLGAESREQTEKAEVRAAVQANGYVLGQRLEQLAGGGGTE